jgi:phosphatidylinositol dimannoside acyltransferase
MRRQGFCSRRMDAAPTTSLRRRLGLFGDLPTRLLRHCLRVVPWFLEPVLIAAWTFLFFLAARSQRRAVASNLRALHPGWGRVRAVFGAWRVFWNFAVTFVDAMRCQTETGALDWAIEGLEAFEDLTGRDEGCIILTAHMGNYDIAAPMFSSRFKKTLYAVRAPEREAETQKIRERQLRENESAHAKFRTLYNKEGAHLGVELARLLREGNLVAVQGDRVVFDVSPMDVGLGDGLVMRLPKGPLYLARVTGAPCFPLFILRDGWRRYRVIVFPALELPARQRGEDAAAAQVWAGPMLEIIRRHWNQWYVFEPVLERRRQ